MDIEEYEWMLLDMFNRNILYGNTINNYKVNSYGKRSTIMAAIKLRD